MLTKLDKINQHHFVIKNCNSSSLCSDKKFIPDLLLFTSNLKIIPENHKKKKIHITKILNIKT